eukprot:16431853-Heterocapsa_arctica.AAC.1
MTRHGMAHYMCISKGPGANECRTKTNSVIDDDRQRVYVKHGLVNSTPRCLHAIAVTISRCLL